MRPIQYKDQTFKKDLDYGYAVTVHKSQGSTYTNAIVDDKDISNNQKNTERNQIKYVALSRPTNLAVVLSNKALGSDNRMKVKEAIQSGKSVEDIAMYNDGFGLSNQELTSIANELGSKESKSMNASEVYNQLGNKTKSGNVVIESVYQQKGIDYAKSIGGVFSMRVNSSNKHFGNPFSSVQAEIDKGLIPTKSTKESVERYIDWVLNSSEERAKWIREILKSGSLKNKPVVYYKELGEPSHATALDYLINKYDWENYLENTTNSLDSMLDDSIVNDFIKNCKDK